VIAKSAQNGFFSLAVWVGNCSDSKSKLTLESI